MKRRFGLFLAIIGSCIAYPFVLLASSGEFDASKASPSSSDLDYDIEDDEVLPWLEVGIHACPCTVDA